jgi:hypothetical protein
MRIDSIFLEAFMVPSLRPPLFMALLIADIC